MKASPLILLPIILLCLFLGSFIVFDLYRQAEEEVTSLFNREHLLAAAQIASNIESDLRSHADGLTFLASSPSLRQPDLAQAKDDIERYYSGVSKDHVRAIFILDASGNIIWSTTPGAIGSHHDQTELFARARANHNKAQILAVWSEARAIEQDAEANVARVSASLNPLPGQFILVAPFYREIDNSPLSANVDNVFGVLAMTIDLEAVLAGHKAHLLATVKQPYLWLIAANGAVLAHSEHPAIMAGSIRQRDESCSQCHLSYDDIEAILRGKRGTLTYELKSHPMKLAAFAPLQIANASWIAVINVPYDTVTTFIRKKFRHQVLYLLAVVAATGLTAALFYRNYRLKVRAQEEARLWRQKLELENKIKESQRHYRTIVESAHDAIWILDKQGNFAFLNKRAEEITGCKLPECAGKSGWTLFHPDDLPRVQELCGKALKGEPQSYETKLLTDRGKTMLLSVNTVAHEEGGEVVGTVSFARDITLQRGLEQQLRAAQKMEAVGRLAGGIAHDFNNILTAIMGYNERTLGQVGENDPLRKNAQEIENAARRAAELTRKLLTFSRKQVCQPQILDMDKVVHGMDRMLRCVIGENIDLRIRTTDASGYVNIDPTQIEQVISNLVINARDAITGRGIICIETAHVRLDEQYARQCAEATPGEYIMISVSDNGAGMTPEVKAHLFEPFFTTKPLGTGTGLGLATCHGIIRQSNGFIHVYSEEGRGTTVAIYLPRVEHAAELPSSLAEHGAPPRGSETVLLVEDEPALQELAAEVLSDLGYTVLTAANGAEALRVIAERDGKRIDLLLTDVVMPQMGGKELAEHLRNTKSRAKVLFASGYTEDAVIQQGVEKSKLAFLQKPYTTATLACKVREVLDAPQ